MQTWHQKHYQEGGCSYGQEERQRQRGWHGDSAGHAAAARKRGKVPKHIRIQQKARGYNLSISKGTKGKRKSKGGLDNFRKIRGNN